ncbi:polar amino acid transport system permease protein [Amycolatopsis bartoniae]|uniref:Ectoine/hydroxyectoine ABC transporter permease subunit EhuC n=1 Tax=Amycolatopsis bartoniae TaxID=941986 RepID=A0A8H9J668_9PSEU|nr:ectoine/hydroxyectoine ABC transporter permease subunit EhuC [Amycolatopsis bartoniae]MBB2936216.1 polar amino acid transport system permease protein [Amycolatopsis bartoniae]TVT11618.1 ectoine/hydroxyectoine ABC transporter permease subunit EhuC [Amycolatopsis bartoniae]GHF80720.1 ectoine/hydroxyectoine ABC transporter permease subunit EhuC [Amycolatopsis bartoniae]
MSDSTSYIVSSILSGLSATVSATLGGIALAIVLSLLAGLAMLSRLRPVRFVSRVYVEVFRGTSEVVQLFWLYFVLPALVGLKLVPLFAGILVLGLNHGAYGAEIVRGAVQSVPKAQREGAVALSLSPAQRMLRVLLPQAVVEMYPPFNNLFIQLLKSTALLTFISAGEITEKGELLRPVYGSQLVFIYGVELLCYLVLAVVITLIMRALERLGSRRLGRRPVARSRLFARTAGVS